MSANHEPKYLKLSERHGMRDTYTLLIYGPMNEQTCRIAHKSWASICGHLAHLELTYESAQVRRDSDEVVVLKYEPGGVTRNV